MITTPVVVDPIRGVKWSGGLLTGPTETTDPIASGGRLVQVWNCSNNNKRGTWFGLGPPIPTQRRMGQQPSFSVWAVRLNGWLAESGWNPAMFLFLYVQAPRLSARPGIGGQTGGPARSGTGPSKHGPFSHDPLKHENIIGPCRACPWAEVPAQARPEIDLIGSGRSVWPGSPAARKCLNWV